MQIFEDVFHHISSQLSENELEQMHRCLTVRFFYRFCVPFGILKDEKDRFFNKKPSDAFEKTEFFMNFFADIVKSSADRRRKPASEKNELGRFTPTAQEFWSSLNPQMRIRLMNNVFYVSCKGETGIGNVSGSVKRGDLILKGICTKCGESVVRLIEGQ